MSDGYESDQSIPSSPPQDPKTPYQRPPLGPHDPPPNFNQHVVDEIPVLQVSTSDGALYQAAQNKSHLLVYPFRFWHATHHMLLDTRADKTVILARFALWMFPHLEVIPASNECPPSLVFGACLPAGRIFPRELAADPSSLGVLLEPSESVGPL